jgi:PAS domain S-box-containing protein
MPDWGVTFLQDSTSGIFIWTSPTLANARSGDLVEIGGRTAPGDFAPVVEQPQIRVLGKAPLPPARPFRLEELVTGTQDSQWVEVQGIVYSVGFETRLPPKMREVTPALVLGIAAEGRRFNARIGGFRKDVSYDYLVDKVVTVRGVCGTLFNDRRQLVGIQLFVPNLDQVHIAKEEGPSHAALVISPIGGLMQFTPGQTSGHRIRVQGVVTLDKPGQLLFVQDHSGGVLAESKQNTAVEPGDRVEVVGFPTSGQYEPVLKEAVFQRVGRGALPTPVDLTLTQEPSGAHDAELVKVRGRLIDKSIQGEDFVLTLQAGNLSFTARLESSAANAATRSVPLGSLLETTGVWWIETAEYPNPTTFRVFLRSAQDIIVLARPSWWTAKQIVSLLVVLAAIILASAMWVVLLRRRVEEQTETIRATLESTADGIVVVDSSHKIVAHNRKFAEMWSVPQTVLESREHDAVLNFLALQLEHPDAFLANARQISGDSEAQVDDRIELKDGRIFERHSEPQRIKGKSVGRVWGFRDITERVRAEDELRLAHFAMEHAWDAIY